MNELEGRIEKAQIDKKELEKLLQEYQPFLKKQLGKEKYPTLEYEDSLSLAMITFVSCIKQYTKGRGGFLAFVAACIRNRLIDEGRKQKKHWKASELTQKQEEGIEQKVSLELYQKSLERSMLCDEIQEASEKLLHFGISFDELAKICPKQEKSRRQCFLMAKSVLETPNMYQLLFSQRRLAQAQLADIFCVSAKTIEKHRKYIVALAVLLQGDYPFMKAFLPKDQEVKQ